MTHTGVSGARLDYYTEHLPGKGWYDYYRIALNTSRGEVFLSEDSLGRASQEKAVDQINQYLTNGRQTKLSTGFSMESDWTYFIIVLIAIVFFIGFHIWKRRKKPVAEAVPVLQ